MEDTILARHEAKINAIQSAREQIPMLRTALNREPNNTAIQTALDNAERMSESIDYLCSGPNIIIQYNNAKTALDRILLEKRYFEEALKEPIPQSTFQKWKASGYLHDIFPDAQSDCPFCKGHNTLIHDMKEGQYSCRQCSHVLHDGINTDLKHMGYLERKERNGSQRFAVRSVAGKEDSAQASSAAANKYKYECRTYMMERLAQVQSKETIKVSKEDMLKIQHGLIKYRFTNGVDGWTSQEMKNFLSKIRLPHLYCFSFLSTT